MKNYITKSRKSKSVQKIINEALEILESVGIPLNTRTERGMEKMAVCFLAVSGVKKDWSKAVENANLKSRDIINFVNENFEEKISSGSYDDIRRKDLKLLVLADIIINSGVNKGSATNDPTRGYALHPDFKSLIITYKTTDWKRTLQTFNENKPTLAEILSRKRNLEQIPVKLPNGKPLELSLGKHNILQKEIIEQFLPRFGSDCSVLYIGDTSNKSLHIEMEELKKLNFFELSHNELPDIIAYSEKKNWLYLIEAVHSSGPMSEIRVHQLKKLLKDSEAELIFVTAFLNRIEFRKWVIDVA
jgi:type II restriction enzyme